MPVCPFCDILGHNVILRLTLLLAECQDSPHHDDRTKGRLSGINLRTLEGKEEIYTLGNLVRSRYLDRGQTRTDENWKRQ